MIQPLDPNTLTGLSEAEATLRLKQEGYNELPAGKRRNIITIALEVLSEPIFLLLVACGIIYWLLGDRQEALILLGFIFFIMGITLYQDQKTESALEAPRDLSSPRASVIRDGQKKRIAGREVVRGDILILSEGDRVPADAVLLASTNLTADESLLTGESVPVRKATGDRKTPMGHPGGDDLPFVYSGTLIVQGQGIAEVKAIGNRTELGKIGKALQSVVTEDTPLQRETKTLVSQLIWIAIAICVAVIVIYGLTRGNWLNGFLAGLALAMAILPNEFPVVLTIFPALGAWRISQNRVLTRRMPAVETLGSATILCVDKTGTLTLNQMSVGQMVAFGDSVFQSYPYDLNLHERESLPEDVHGLIEYSILASQKDPFDPMEKAFKQLGDDYLSQTEHLHNDWRLVHEYPLSPVARESADLVLLDDDFSSIVQAVKSGRRIFDNLKKAMAYTLAIHVPIAGMSLIPVLFKWPLVLLPIHIAFLHLIIDPACSVVFEAEPPEANVMNRPPRNPKEPLFGRQMLTLSVMQGVGVLLILIIIFAIALYRKQGKLDARALAFTTLIVANLSLILTNRSWSRTIFAIVQAPNPALWWVIGGAIAFMGLALYIPVLRHLFRFSTLHPIDLGICLVGGIISVIWFEWLKVRKHLSKPNQGLLKKSFSAYFQLISNDYIHNKYCQELSDDFLLILLIFYLSILVLLRGIIVLLA